MRKLLRSFFYGFTFFYLSTNWVHSTDFSVFSDNPEVQEVRKYLSSLEEAPCLVFGVTSSEDGVERFDKKWIFVDIYHPQKAPRHLTLNFNTLGDLQQLASHFPATFQCIAFDAEVPTYLEGFTPIIYRPFTML